MILLQASVDVLKGYLQLSVEFKLEFCLEAGTTIVVLVLKRLQERLAAIDKPAQGQQDIRAKVEIKILIDFVKRLLLESDILSQIYLQYDFTCVRRPLVAGLLSTSVKVESCQPDIQVVREDKGRR